jgi:hypothetical protein
MLNKKPAVLALCFQTGFLLSLFFDSEDGGDMFFQNVGSFSTNYLLTVAFSINK